MFTTILKKILSYSTIQIHYHSGDIIDLKISLGDKIIVDRRIDVIRGA